MQEREQNIHVEVDDSKLYYGFWMYLMTDIILFGTLFATYGVLRSGTNGGPTSQQIFNLSHVFIETILMTTITLTSALAMLYITSKRKLLGWYAITFFLGLVFVWMTCTEYSDLIGAGNTWQRSAFLSSYFTLSGLHLLHIFVGLLWTILLLIPVIQRGVDHVSLRRLTCLRIYWQFLTVVWIFVFSFIYLPGVL